MLKETASPLNGFFYFDFLRERRTKRNIDNPLILSISKIYPSIYIYHHIDTQPTESHFDDCTNLACLVITTRHTDMNNLFVTFYRFADQLLYKAIQSPYFSPDLYIPLYALTSSWHTLLFLDPVPRKPVSY